MPCTKPIYRELTLSERFCMQIFLLNLLSSRENLKNRAKLPYVSKYILAFDVPGFTKLAIIKRHRVDIAM